MCFSRKKSRGYIILKKPIIIHVSGDSGSGKTTLIVKLIPFLKKLGYRVGAIKHAHHGFEIDIKGKDSYRMSKAGAGAVVLSSPDRVAIFKKGCKEENLAWLIEQLKDEVDIILIEGYAHRFRFKNIHIPKDKKAIRPKLKG